MNKEMKTLIVVSSHDIQLDSDYVKWICDVKQRFRNIQIKAAVKVNSEQLSLDLQSEFPLTKGFSARNLWSMKKWYSFYSSSSESEYLLQNLTEQLDLSSIKLNQIGAEMRFPTVFDFVPWRHHVEIVNKCKTVEEGVGLWITMKNLSTHIPQNNRRSLKRSERDISRGRKQKWTNFAVLTGA